MDIRLIVFDLDGTLYDINDVIQNSYDTQVKFLSQKYDKSEDDVKLFLSKNHIYPYLSKESKSATELFLQMGIDKREWSDFREERFDEGKIDIRKAIDESTIINFSRYVILVLLSSNSYKIIERILKHLGISPSIFQEIICSDRCPFQGPFNKKSAIETISTKYSVQYEKMLSIGDRFSTDILPMLQLGGKGVLLSKPLTLRMVLNDFLRRELHTNLYYGYYSSL